MKTITLTDAEYDEVVKAVQVHGATGELGPWPSNERLLAVLQGTWVQPSSYNRDALGEAIERQYMHAFERHQAARRT